MMTVLQRVQLVQGKDLCEHSLPMPTMLEIVQCDEVWNDIPYTSFFLYSLNEAGNALGDTWHETLADALRQAEYQFGVKPDRWEAIE
jgi:hypothetical protein